MYSVDGGGQAQYKKMTYPIKISCDPKKREKEIKIHYIVKPLYIISRILFVWPYKYGKFNETHPLSFLYKFLAYLICVGIVGMASFHIYNHVVELQSSFQILDFLTILYEIFIQLIGIVSIIKAANFGLKNDFFLMLDEIGQGGLHSNELIAMRNKFLLFGMMLIIILATHNVSMLVTFDPENDLLSIVNFLSYCGCQLILVVFFVQVTWKLHILLVAMNKVNTGISRTFLHISKINAGQELRKLLQRHAQLSGLIKSINDMHGVQIVFLFCAVVILNLFSLYGFIVDGKNSSVDPAHYFQKQGLKLINILYFNGLLFMLVSASTKLRSEIENTGTISANFLLEMETQPSSMLGDECKKKLKKFLQQVYVRSPDITGADVFVVDFAIVSSVVGAVTSYFIVILQFKE